MSEQLNYEQVVVPLGLLSRLLANLPDFVSQFDNSLLNPKVFSYVCSCVADDSPTQVICDALFLLTQSIRFSATHLESLEKLFITSDRLILLLDHEGANVRSRVASFIGNMCKHSSTLFMENAPLTRKMIECLRDSDGDVRKCSCYALGNVCYHNGDMAVKLKPFISQLVSLLHDPSIKTRAHAATTLSNLTIHSDCCVADLIEHRRCDVLLDLLTTSQEGHLRDVLVNTLSTFANDKSLKTAIVGNSDAMDRLMSDESEEMKELVGLLGS